MRRSYARRFALLAVLLCGCSESVRLKSSPPGASIYINEKALGDTPVTFTTEPGASMRRPWRYRLEYKGTPVSSGEIETRVSQGRLWGTVFTAGILMLFRSPRVFISDEILFRFFTPDALPPPYFSQLGTGSIAGQAFAVTRGDDVKPAAGRAVLLHPDSAAIRDYYAAFAVGEENRAYTLVGAPPENFTKTTIADATGTFQFDGLAPGRYVVVSSVNWTHFAGFNYTQIGTFGWLQLSWATEGGLMIRQVEVKEGQATKVVLTR